jgi:hypothetical protein
MLNSAVGQAFPQFVEKNIEANLFGYSFCLMYTLIPLISRDGLLLAVELKKIRNHENYSKKNENSKKKITRK